jgi:uncharacterized protein YbbC (DUF1343 family)
MEMDKIRTGLERWLVGGAKLGSSAGPFRVGLLAHAASIDGRARHALELIRTRESIRPERIFAPEHGLWGHEQDMEGVEHGTEPLTGLPVVSLYGADRSTLAPSRESLEGLDLIVCDLQDVGSRYYTFVYTLSHVMEAAREADLPVLVLDRPNPIGGLEIEGPVLRDEWSSFVGRYALPARHGMTVGELACMFNEAFGIGCDLHVVQMEGWRRSMSFEQTGLPWVPPSPNMPTPATARVYPGGCLVEGTNLSEGRGTTTPFALVGAPWLDGHALAKALNGHALPGVHFRAASFRPMFQKHANLACGGVHVLVHDPATYRPFACYWEVLREALALDSARFSWRSDEYEFETDRLAMDLLLGRGDLRQFLEQGVSHAEVEPLWRGELADFARMREPFLLYP